VELDGINYFKTAYMKCDIV